MIAARSPVMRMAVQASSPLALVVAAYLFFAGHNRPGGGFAAGLVIGAVVALRTISGLRRPANANTLLATGGLVAASVTVAPLVFGGTFLDQVVWKFELPVLGTVKSGTALLFDAGVTLIVVGLFEAVIAGFGTRSLGLDDPAGQT